jgi:NADH:ubiquinone oxidoreductase subunit B-like Fe-S oxidoreductase
MSAKNVICESVNTVVNYHRRVSLFAQYHSVSCDFFTRMTYQIATTHAFQSTSEFNPTIGRGA